MRARDRGLVALGIAAGVPWLLAGAATVALWSHRDRLPDRVATHWGESGADGYSSLPTALTVAGLIVVLLPTAIVLLTTLLDRTGSSRHVAAGLALGLSGFVAGVAYGTLWAQRDGATDVPVGAVIAGSLAGALVVGALLGGWAWSRPLAPDRPLPAPDVSAVRVPVRPGAAVAWTGFVRPPALVTAGLAGVLLIDLVLLAAVGGWQASVPATVIAVLIVVTLSGRVTIDRRGLRVRALGVLPWMTVRPENMAEAAVVEVKTLADYGGWGYRIGRDGSRGVVLRSGEALRVECVGRPSVVITVDSAEEAAGLLNTLLERQRV